MEKFGGGRKREYDYYFLRRCLRGRETPCGGRVWVARHPGQRSVDGDFFEELDFLGSFSYDEKEDALRVNVKPHAAESLDVLTYVFEDVKPDSAAATLRWEKLAVPSAFPWT